MKLYTLTIKGESFQVDRALSDHGFGGELKHELEGCCVVHVAARDDEDRLPELQAWFGEASMVLREGRLLFPVGTLLYFREFDWEEVADATSDRIGQKLLDPLDEVYVVISYGGHDRTVEVYSPEAYLKLGGPEVPDDGLDDGDEIVERVQVNR